MPGSKLFFFLSPRHAMIYFLLQTQGFPQAQLLLFHRAVVDEGGVNLLEKGPGDVRTEPADDFSLSVTGKEPKSITDRVPLTHVPAAHPTDFGALARCQLLPAKVAGIDDSLTLDSFNVRAFGHLRSLRVPLIGKLSVHYLFFVSCHLCSVIGHLLGILFRQPCLKGDHEARCSFRIALPQKPPEQFHNLFHVFSFIP